MHRVAQITDIHIGAAGEDTYGVDVRRNLAAVFEVIRAREADEIIVTGDICFDVGVAEVYAWLREQLEAVGLPFRVLPGNHDDAGMLADAFGLSTRDGELFDVREVHGRTEIFLDTTATTLSSTQQAFLREALAAATGEAIVWMHHPPCLGGVRYMDDNYPLKNHAEVTPIFAAHGAPVHVFVGHHHANITIRSKAAAPATVYLTPSTFFQLHPEFAGFQVDHRRPGFRLIDFDADTLRTQVLYLEAGFSL